MLWPVYPYSGVSPELDRHAAAQADAERRPGPPGAFALALDIWRDGDHLWRSYPLDKAEDIREWADRELAPDVAWNFDAGRWQASGLQNVHLWPIPTASALMPVTSLAVLRDIILTCFAIGQLPDYPPAGLDLVPPESTFATRLRRATGNTLTWTLYEPVSRVSIRAFIGHHATPVASAPLYQWHAKLEKREVRAGATQTTLKEGEAMVYAPDKPHLVVRAAKAALGVSGWPAQRQGQALTWHLSRAPYRIAVQRA